VGSTGVTPVVAGMATLAVLAVGHAPARREDVSALAARAPKLVLKSR